MVFYKAQFQVPCCCLFI